MFGPADLRRSGSVLKILLASSLPPSASPTPPHPVSLSPLAQKCRSVDDGRGRRGGEAEVGGLSEDTIERDMEKGEVKKGTWKRER